MIDKEEFIKRLRREMNADHIKYVSIEYVGRVLETIKTPDATNCRQNET